MSGRFTVTSTIVLIQAPFGDATLSAEFRVDRFVVGCKSHANHVSLVYWDLRADFL